MKIGILILSLIFAFPTFAKDAKNEDAKTEVEAPCCEKNLQSTVGQESSDRESLIKVSSLLSKEDEDGKARSGKSVK